MFVTRKDRNAFCILMAVAIAGLFLPWENALPGVASIIWGYQATLFIFLQCFLVFTFTFAKVESPVVKKAMPIITELLLLSIPLGYLCFWIWWEWMFITGDWERIFQSLLAYRPFFWIAFALTFVPIIGFPILYCRRTKTPEPCYMEWKAEAASPTEDIPFFLTKRRKIIFWGLMALWGLGLFLPWFSFDSFSVSGFRGSYALQCFVFQPLLVFIITGYTNYSRKRAVAVWLLLLSIPAIYLYFMGIYPTPLASGEVDFVKGMQCAAPTFWFALALTFVPLIGFPLLVRRKKPKEIDI